MVKPTAHDVDRKKTLLEIRLLDNRAGKSERSRNAVETICGTVKCGRAPPAPPRNGLRRAQKNSGLGDKSGSGCRQKKETSELMDCTGGICLARLKGNALTELSLVKSRNAGRAAAAASRASQSKYASHLSCKLGSKKARPSRCMGMIRKRCI